MKTIFEPFKIKMVEPLVMHSCEERRGVIREAFYNLFTIKASDVTFDFLTDSGTSAMSAKQWADMLIGDESYAGSSSYQRFERVVAELTGKSYVIPTHQGRSAEALLCHALLRPGQQVIGNTQFDTTRANIESAGAISTDLPCKESEDSQAEYPFKGNVDLIALRAMLQKHHDGIALFIMTITNNSIGGQPVSLENIQNTKRLLQEYGIPFFIDAARFAENAYFIKSREVGQSNRSVAEIAREVFHLADGVLMSAKKDAFANIGGFLAVNDPKLAETIRQRMVITEGFPTYGGLAGRDLEAIATGLEEIQDENYLAYRLRSVEYFGRGFESAGFKVVKPFGGHAVYIDAGRTASHLKPSQFPAQALAIALYEEIGLRAVEVGSLMFGRVDEATGKEVSATKELVRLAIPRRVYTQSHIDYILECAHGLAKIIDRLPGYRILEQAKFLRHFTAKLSREDKT